MLFKRKKKKIKASDSISEEKQIRTEKEMEQESQAILEEMEQEYQEALEYECPYCGSDNTDGAHCFNCGGDF